MYIVVSLWEGCLEPKNLYSKQSGTMVECTLWSVSEREGCLEQKNLYPKQSGTMVKWLNRVFAEISFVVSLKSFFCVLYMVRCARLKKIMFNFFLWFSETFHVWLTWSNCPKGISSERNFIAPFLLHFAVYEEKGRRTCIVSVHYGGYGGGIKCLLTGAQPAQLLIESTSNFRALIDCNHYYLHSVTKFPSC